MKLPYMKTAASKTKRQIVAFGGVNYGLGASDGELLESFNLSSARFPCLSQRDGRKHVNTYDNPAGLYARQGLFVVDGLDLIYNGNVVGHLSGNAEDKRSFATINTKVVIFPDKMFYDFETGALQSLEAEYQCFGGDVEFDSNTLTVTKNECYTDQASEETKDLSNVGADEEITAYTEVEISENGTFSLSGDSTKKKPSALESGDLIRYDGGKETEYMEVKSVEQETATTYCIHYQLHEIVVDEYPDFESASFKAGDAVEISDCETCSENNGTHIVRSVDGRTLTFTDDIFSATGTESGAVKLKRKVPDLTCVCECDNRIWGAEGTTIYASALGDPTNFYVYDGLSTDSYAAPVGTDGEFTGCIAYSSTVLFWKEHCVHKVLGSYPSQYEIYTYTVPGVQAGSEKSLCVINETLFYKGKDGVYAYNGGTPELISENFGLRRFKNAAAGSDGQRYYISMKDENTEEWNMYVFDTLCGIWLREDETCAIEFAYLNGTLYCLDGDTGSVMMLGQNCEEEGHIPWSATLCQMDETVHGKKGYSKLYLRADMDAGAWMKAEISADGAPFKQVFVTHNELAKTVQIPILPTRCDNFRIRLSGQGGCIIKSIVREFSIGSEY